MARRLNLKEFRDLIELGRIVVDDDGFLRITKQQSNRPHISSPPGRRDGYCVECNNSGIITFGGGLRKYCDCPIGDEKRRQYGPLL